MNLTEEQKMAVNLEGNNILVSAGAGSGKTAVLSERVIRKLKDNIDIRDILILTFTNEAAGEMSSRIRKKIKAAGLINELEHLDQAYITTFDAFALNLVKKYHYILNISKDIKIIDSSVIDLKKLEYINEIFLKLYEEKDSNFLSLIDNFTSKDDESIKSAILALNKDLDLKYDKKTYLENYISEYYNDEYYTKIFNEYFKYIKTLCEDLENLCLLLESYIAPSSYETIYNTLSKFFKPITYNDLHKYKDLSLPKFTKLDEDGQKIKEDIQNKFKELIDLIYYDEAYIKNSYFSTQKYIEVIIKIINELDEKIMSYKTFNNSYEFNDIAKFAITIVKNNESIKNELKNKFNEIMIDEYQDTSDLQETFIKYIENDNVYMVGDIKQSIYRFRNANPMIFKEKYDNYSNNINGIKIDLLKNFRSRSEVLDNINDIFAPLMTKDITGINYKESHAMIFGNTSYNESGKNNYNNNMDILTYKSDDKNYSQDEIEAFIIAKDIKEKLNQNYLVYDFDLKENRKATYNDFCIILDRGSKMALFKKVFEYFNIPMEIYKDSNLMAEDDIYIIKNIINLILCIKSGIYDKNLKYYFTSVARSYIGSLSDAEIFSSLEENKIFTTKIYEISKNISNDLDSLTLNMLLKRIIKDYNFYENIILVGDISARIKRLNYLLDLTTSIEELGLTISDFSNYLDELIKNKNEIKYKENKSTSNSVKLMNIHKSKGLEFPICYFAHLSKPFNIRDLNNKFLYDKTYGIITPYYNDGIGELFTKTLVRNEYFQAEIAEKIRLFYVALTRAKEKIILVAPALEQNPKTKEVPFSSAMKFRSFYNFLESISGNITKYQKNINLSDLSLTKDYEFKKNLKSNIDSEYSPKMTFIDINIPYEEIENHHASKTIKSIISKEENSTLEYGTYMHELLEYTDFKKPSTNKHVNKLLNTFNLKDANIYQELEFIFNKDDIKYHGIIDLMLEYEDKILIIDYKLKNINDINYEKQLKVYYDYINSISDKKIELYLYSIMDNEVKKVEVN